MPRPLPPLLIVAALTGAVSMASALPAWAQAVVGTWQGVYSIPGQSLKEVIRITRGPDGKLHGEAFYPGPEGPPRNGNPISNVEVQGRHVHLMLDDSLATIDADLSADGASLTGTRVQGGLAGRQALPIRFDRATDKTAWPIDPSPHTVRFVEVEKGVKLEVLDWGGKGTPLVFIPGGGNTAHVYDEFAPLFTAKHHVYAITRRGSGLSSKPDPTVDNYNADRLGKDVLEVIDALKLDHPVLAGHSRGGGELSFFGARHPDRVSGLIYLEAAYEYAFYDPKTRSKVEAIRAKGQGLPPPSGGVVFQPSQAPQDKITTAIFGGSERYTTISGPVLAIMADPPACAQDCDSPQSKNFRAVKDATLDGFEAGVPQARVVRIANAEHYIFRSNPDEVEREMNAFMDTLPKGAR